MTTDSPPQESGRRRRRAAERGRGSIAAQPQRQPQRQPQAPFAPLDLVSAEELESIHRAALTVLKEIGIDFLHDEARAMLKDAGADVDPASRRVRFDPALVEAHIGLAPKAFRLHARNPARALSIGGRPVAFGTVASAFEKMALDADLLAMVVEFLRPMRVDDAELALEAMREVGPGGRFSGAEHIQSRYRTAFFPPAISDWRNYESWREAGSPTALDAAERVVGERLRDFVAPPLEAERLEALTAFVARRKAEGGAPTDF